MSAAALAAELDALLPQTQCRQCAYPGCLAYARAMARGRADINRCPPGGPLVAARLAERLGRPLRPIDPSCGRTRPFALARIDESRCIGCVACLRACPVDAIVGARRRMHTVIESECTGCDLCRPVCPVDCIDLIPMLLPGGGGEGGSADSGAFLEAWMRERAPRARTRFARRAARRARGRAARRSRTEDAEGSARADRAAVVAAAISRVRARRRGSGASPAPGGTESTPE